MKKTQKLFTKLAITFGVAFVACMATIPTQMSKYYEEKQEAEYLNAKKYVSYDDEEYVITLSADELNNYSYQNLATYINSGDYTTIGTYITYNQNTYAYSAYLDEGEYYSLEFVYNTDYITYYGDELKFINTDNEDTRHDFMYSIVWYVGEGNYSSIKQAIELDIQANQPQTHTMAGDIIASITAGLGMIGVLAGEFLTGFSTLFWTGSELTTFALFSLVFLGISITFAIISLVLNILRNNTGV